MEKPANQQTTPAIEMTGVTVGSLRDDQEPRLEDVNWRVAVGEFWVVGGMHGAGKTDLVSLAAGLLPPLKGTYRLFGQEMPILGRELLAERLRVGLVFEGGQLFHNLSVADNINLPLLYHTGMKETEADQRLQAMLDMTELTAWAEATPGRLPYSLQKRVALARALMVQPEVLLLDNPLGGLDPRQLNWWMTFMQKMSAGRVFENGKPMTLVVTAEDLRPWRERPAYFAVIREKRFITLGHCPRLAGNSDVLIQEMLAEAAQIVATVEPPTPK